MSNVIAFRPSNDGNVTDEKWPDGDAVVLRELDPLDFTEDVDFIEAKDSYLNEFSAYASVDEFDLPIEYA